MQVRGLLNVYKQASPETGVQPNFVSETGAHLPYPLWDSVLWPSVECLTGASSHKLVYLVTDKREQQHLFKFTRQYGVATHKVWAAYGVAPDLLAEPICLPGPWWQIQMEYLPDTKGWLPMIWLMQDEAGQARYVKNSSHILSSKLRPQLKQEAKQLLIKAHQAKVDGQPAAHGDARPENFMVHMHIGNIVAMKLVDLDWAGPVTSVRYPILLNTQAILWPKGVDAGQPIKQEHDLQLLDLQTDTATIGGFYRWNNLPAGQS